MKESRTYLQNIKNTQEYPPKTVLEQELAMELQTLLDDKNFKGPKLDITLYIIFQRSWLYYINLTF